MFFKSKEKSSMEQEIFEQAEVLGNLLRTHVNDNNYISVSYTHLTLPTTSRV